MGTGGARAPSWVTFPNPEMDARKSERDGLLAPALLWLPANPLYGQGRLPGWGPPGTVWGMARDSGWGPSWDKPITHFYFAKQADGFRLGKLKGS